MAAEEKVTYRIGVVTGLFMLMFTIVADLLQFLLTLLVVTIPVAYLVTFLAQISLFIWLAILGVSYFGGKKAYQNLIALGSSVIIELVPIISALPAITAATAFIIFNSRAEDREKFKANKPKVLPGRGNSAQSQAINENQRKFEAANDNGQEEESRQAA